MREDSPADHDAGKEGWVSLPLFALAKPAKNKQCYQGIE